MSLPAKKIKRGVVVHSTWALPHFPVKRSWRSKYLGALLKRLLTRLWTVTFAWPELVEQLEPGKPARRVNYSLDEQKSYDPFRGGLI